MTPLHEIGQAVRDALQLVPLGAVRAIVVALLVLLLMWVIRLPRAATVDVRGGDRGVDLRWGAAAALVIQIVIYVLL